MESAEELVIDTVVTKLLALIDKGPRGHLSADQLALLKSHLLISHELSSALRDMPAVCGGVAFSLNKKRDEGPERLQVGSLVGMSIVAPDAVRRGGPGASTVISDVGRGASFISSRSARKLSIPGGAPEDVSCTDITMQDALTDQKLMTWQATLHVCIIE
ncbi:hypothetical protein PILCRDRAFT_92894 [Piloderma croceum F 1598]|uniref:Uncharacterized protein n=1 Tax=Piloderma croceum (strain F 1598) TaxID=765440 RepID=A0A0C3AIU0_PILCF|nr:hypothetical protein PILCRDRAFT_92894 [Piloderma croceum F 1598]